MPDNIATWASPPPPLVVWAAHEGRNCWWDGHGAEEVDQPAGTAVYGVTTETACKDSCLSVRDAGCEGILFNAGKKLCYRKTSIDVARCPRDSNFVLYVRTDPNRPPAAPHVKPQGLMTSKSCTAAMRDKNHKFYTIWALQGWSVRRQGWPACWGDGDWFRWVALTRNCKQNWGMNLRAPSVFGFAETMEGYCKEKAGEGWNVNGDLQGACGRARLNILRTGGWNMCRNTEWMICIIKGAGAGGDQSIIFSLEPKMLDLSHYSDNINGYSENDIYYLEVCTLNEMCSNHEEIFEKEVGEQFRCQFDEERWAQYGRDMIKLG